LNILAFLFHTVQEFEDKNYIELRSIIGTRKEFFNNSDILTTMFVFKNYDMLIGFILSKRRREEIRMRDYIMF
jgi:hypothetical protein